MGGTNMNTLRRDWQPSSPNQSNQVTFICPGGGKNYCRRPWLLPKWHKGVIRQGETSSGEDIGGRIKELRGTEPDIVHSIAP